MHYMSNPILGALGPVSPILPYALGLAGLPRAVGPEQAAAEGVQLHGGRSMTLLPRQGLVARPSGHLQPKWQHAAPRVCMHVLGAFHDLRLLVLADCLRVATCNFTWGWPWNSRVEVQAGAHCRDRV